MLYAAPAGALTDVTKGVQKGCSLGDAGFPAVDGWDAVTGLGSPNYEQLLAYVSDLP